MSNQTPAVSIIVAVYKAENYLHRCVDSLLAQTFTDFEILLIDDGSPDRSGDICDEYARMDSRIRVFHKENGGVSSARQCGIDHAKGEYTIHADPDDWVEPTMLEELYKKAKEEDADMVICDYYSNSILGQKYISQKPTTLEPCVILHDIFLTLSVCVWNKLIKRHFLKNAGFPKGIDYGEDFIVCIQVLLQPIKISYLDQAFYHYSQDDNPNTLSRSFDMKRFMMMEKLTICIGGLLEGLDFDNELIGLKKDHAYFALLGQLLTAKEFNKRFRDLLPFLSNRNLNDLCLRIAFINYSLGVMVVRLRLFLGKTIREKIKKR